MIRYCSEETSITASSSPVQVSVSGPFGVHDSLRNGGARSVTADLQPPHPLLRQHAASGPVSADWTRKCVLGGQQIGLHMPLRLNLERELLSNKRLGGLPSSNLAADILMGRDETLEFDDFLSDSSSKPPLNNEIMFA